MLGSCHRPVPRYLRRDCALIIGRARSGVKVLRELAAITRPTSSVAGTERANQTSSATKKSSMYPVSAFLAKNFSGT